MFFFFLALQPPLVVVFYSPLTGFSLLAYEVSWSHTTTHHSRYDSSGRVISPSQRPSVAETSTWQHTTLTTDKHPFSCLLIAVIRNLDTGLRLFVRIHSGSFISGNRTPSNFLKVMVAPSTYLPVIMEKSVYPCEDSKPSALPRNELAISVLDNSSYNNENVTKPNVCK